MFDSFGLDISDSSLKYAYVKRGLFGVYLDSFGELKVSEGLIVGGEIKDLQKTSAYLRDAFKNIRGLPSFATVSLPDSKTFIKLLKVTMPESGDVRAAVMQELANHIPIPLDQLIIDWCIIDHQMTRVKKVKRASSFQPETIPKEFRVLVAACESHIVHDYGMVLREAGITPIAFEIEAQATARAILSQEDIGHDLNKATVVLDWGESQATIIFFAGGTLVFSASSEISGKEVTKKIAERLSMDFGQAEQAKLICGLNQKKCKGVVRQYLEQYIGLLAGEVKKGYEFYTSHIFPGGLINSIILVGGGSNLKDLDSELERVLSISVKPTFGNIFKNVPEIRNTDIMPKIKRVSFATAVGLALRTIV